MKNPGSAVATSSEIDLDYSYGDESSSEEESEIKRQLAGVTFEELQRARSDGSSLVYGKHDNYKTGRRANKNRPMEMSVKKPVSRFRGVLQSSKRVVRDPRFESLCGNLNVDGFKKRYNFLYEEGLPAEKENLEKELKRVKDTEVRNELKGNIAWIDKELKSASTKRTDKDILAKHKKKEREAAKQGKQPYYLKKSEVRKQILMDKFKKLKESGKLEAFMERKRRKNTSKDRRFMPYRRPVE